MFSGMHRRVMEGSGLGSPGCVVFFILCVWRLSYVVDSCNIVATEHSRYGLSCIYICTRNCRVHEQC